jgi:phosphonoacetaldehyde hydrolase
MNLNLAYRNSYRGAVKAVILDWAGTAVDFGSFAPAAVFLRLFEGEGVEITPLDARIGMGLMKKDHLRAILTQRSVAQAWEAAHGGPATEADIDRLFDSFVPMQLLVLEDYARPISGLLEVIQELRQRGIKIGSTTGYVRTMMDILAPKAREYGYEPDCIVCPDEVPAGRPYPWMCYMNAIKLGVYPLESIVKVGDTVVDIEEGLNSGMWTVGLSLTGNITGLSEAEVNSLDKDKRQDLRRAAETQLFKAGAHYVIDGIWDLPKVLDGINTSLTHGVRP